METLAIVAPEYAMHQYLPSATLQEEPAESWLYEITQRVQGQEDSTCYVMVPNVEDLVKSHLMFAVREEVEVLKEKISELMDRINQLEYENNILKAQASQETLSQLTTTGGTTNASNASTTTAAVAAAVAASTVPTVAAAVAAAAAAATALSSAAKVPSTAAPTVAPTVASGGTSTATSTGVVPPASAPASTTTPVVGNPSNGSVS